MNAFWKKTYSSPSGACQLTVTLRDESDNSTETMRHQVAMTLYIPGKVYHPRFQDEGANVMDLYLHPKPIAALFDDRKIPLPEALVKQAKADTKAAISSLEAAKRAEWAKKDTRTLSAFVGSSAGFAGENILRRNWLREILVERGHGAKIEETTHHTRCTVSREEADTIEQMIEERWQAHVKSIEAAANAASPAQLWEPCERCGAEPSYMTPRGHLCRKCQNQ